MIELCLTKIITQIEDQYDMHLPCLGAKLLLLIENRRLQTLCVCIYNVVFDRGYSVLCVSCPRYFIHSLANLT